jgi:alpha-tubulin suppressor-like RCC1 family protein
VGQLGTGNTTSYSSPVQTVAGGTNWQSLAQPLQLNIAGAIKTDGTLWVWGTNTYGQLGDNTVVSKSSPVQTVAGGTNWRQASLGPSSIALKTDGSVWAWGFNHKGQLADGTTTSRSSPVQIISGSTNWITAITNSGYTMFAIGY